MSTRSKRFAKKIIRNLDQIVRTDDTFRKLYDRRLKVEVRLTLAENPKYEGVDPSFYVDIYSDNSGNAWAVEDWLWNLRPELDIMVFNKNGDPYPENDFFGPKSEMESKSKKVPYLWNVPEADLRYLIEKYEGQPWIDEEAGHDLRPYFDPELLKEYCYAPFEHFFELGEVIDTPTGSAVWIKRGSKVLGVAHMDTVFAKDTEQHFIENGDFIFAYNLDDRLGAYILLEVLPQLGIVVDVLLTEGEETGQSTGGYFQPKSAKYNWMFQFDRAGTDAVMYQYLDNKPFRSALEDTGFHTAHGLFSDIAFMDHLGICGVNFGCAYYFNHGPDSLMNVPQCLAMIRAFAHFYLSNRDTRYKYTPAPKWNDKKQSKGSHIYTWNGDKWSAESWETPAPGDFDRIQYCIGCGYETTNPFELTGDLCDNCRNHVFGTDYHLKGHRL